MAHLHRIHPSARLHLVGPRWEVGYDTRIERMVAQLGLSDNVLITGKEFSFVCNKSMKLGGKVGDGVDVVKSSRKPSQILHSPSDFFIVFSWDLRSVADKKPHKLMTIIYIQSIYFVRK